MAGNRPGESPCRRGPSNCGEREKSKLPRDRAATILSTMTAPPGGERDEEIRNILGLRFYVGSFPGLLTRTSRGGLIVVPSAPVLVDLSNDPAHREALEGSDLATTDSGFFVLLWLLFKGQRLPRISGLRYLRGLLSYPEFRKPGGPSGSCRRRTTPGRTASGSTAKA